MRLSLFLAAAVALGACNASPSGPVTETGDLERGDATLTSGEFADRFTVRMKAEQWLRVTLQAQGFDPYLVVRFPNGQQSDLDDSTPGDTTSVTMVMKAQEAGQFEILATSYRAGESGSYTLTYEVSDTEPATPAGTAQRAPQQAPADAAATPDALPPPTAGNSIREIDPAEGDGAATADGVEKPPAPATPVTIDA